MAELTINTEDIAAALRKNLEDLRVLIDGGDLAAARSGLDVLLERFRSHEVEEAKLIARLEELSTR